MKLTSQMPSSTSLMPRLWPASTRRDVDLLAMHADAAAGGDEDVAVMEGIGEIGQAVIAARLRRIELGGALHGERLVRPLGIELVHEGVEAGLLLQGCSCLAGGSLPS